MGWFRKIIIKIVLSEIRENGVEIGDFVISNRDGALSIRRK